MSAMPWLQPGDQLILDGADYTVSEIVIGRTDRLSFQLVEVRPSLGGESRRLLQLERRAFAVEPAGLDEMRGEEVSLAGRTLRRRWEDQVRTEVADAQGYRRFGLGRCAYYEGDDDSVGLRIEEGDQAYALVGTLLDGSRLDLRFTESARKRR